MKKTESISQKREKFARSLWVLVMRWLYDSPNHRAPRREIISRLEEHLHSSECAGIEEKFPGIFEKQKRDHRSVWLWTMNRVGGPFTAAKLLRKDKKSNIWHLEEEGKNLLRKEKSVGDIISFAQKKAEEEEKEKNSEDGKEEENVSFSEKEEERDLEKDALQSMQAYIDGLDFSQYQVLVAALLRGMGHHVAEIAPPGADGGIDIVAYKDPLGAAEPRVKVQVKHQKRSVSPDIVRALNGKLKSGDMGIVVCSSSFSKEARREARDSMEKHIRLIDGDEFIDLWQKHYLQMDEQDRAKMPLKQIYVLDSDRIMDE